MTNLTTKLIVIIRTRILDKYIIRKACFLVHGYFKYKQTRLHKVTSGYSMRSCTAGMDVPNLASIIFLKHLHARVVWL